MSNASNLPAKVDPQAIVYRDLREVDVVSQSRALRAMFPKSLANVDEAALRGLVIAGRASGLDPARGEIYLVPGVGIQVASKIKAADAVQYALEHGNYLAISYVRHHAKSPAWAELTASHNVKDGDTVVECRIESSKARQAFFNDRLAKITEIRAMYPGMKGEEIEARVNAEFGLKAPVVSGYGVVRASESFGGEAAEGKFTRTERAQKRALQKALNLGGYAAPDRRSYGGQAIVDEPIEGVDPTIGIVASPPPVIPGVSELVDAPASEAVIEAEVRTVTAPETKAAAVRKDPAPDLKSEAPFGSAPIARNGTEPKPEPKPEPDELEAEDAKAKAVAEVKRIAAIVADRGPSLSVKAWQSAEDKVAVAARAYGLDPDTLDKLLAKDRNRMRELEASVNAIITTIQAKEDALPANADKAETDQK